MLTDTDLDYALVQLQQLIEHSQQQYHHLVLLCNGDWRSRTQVLHTVGLSLNWPYLSVGLPLAENLSPYTPQQRSLHLERELESLLPTESGIVLDHLEILFDADLHLNPVALLERLARQRQVLASWPGQLQEKQLVYAEPWHAEYRTHQLGDLLCYALA